MTRGFKLFLLIILFFTAVWAYQFRALDLARVHALLHTPVVVDLRNVYEPDTMRRLGFRYMAVGRRGVHV